MYRTDEMGCTISNGVVWRVSYEKGLLRLSMLSLAMESFIS